MFVSFFFVSVLGLKKRCELLLVFVCVKKGTSLRCGGRRDVDVFFPKKQGLCTRHRRLSVEAVWRWSRRISRVSL
jgi:hypothetical protein